MKKELLFTLLGAVSLTGTAQTHQQDRPNLVLFISDDCSYYDLGCYGSKDSKTPAIDNFAKEGMRFSKAYQAAPMSSPTRHNLYTGIWPVRSGAYPNHTHANDGTNSIVQQLHPLGYKVALVGKSHIGPASVFPFDKYFPPLKGQELDWASLERFISECIAAKDPFCVIVASHQPHTPWNKGDASQFNPDSVSLPPMYVDCPDTRKDFTKYLAEINYMDGEFSTLLNMLDKKKASASSVVVYLSEQGNSLPFAKWTCYDAGVHSACLIRWPGIIPAGSSSDALIEYVDVLPTFVDIAGGKPITPMDGKSFKGVLTGKSGKHKDYSFSLQTTRGIFDGSDYFGIRSVFDGRYRYILNLTPEMEFRNTFTKSKLFQEWQSLGATDPHAAEVTHDYSFRPKEELYDVASDPYCRLNLIQDPELTDKVAELSAELKKWMDYCDDKGQQTELEALDHISKGKEE